MVKIHSMVFIQHYSNTQCSTHTNVSEEHTPANAGYRWLNTHSDMLVPTYQTTHCKSPGHKKMYLFFIFHLMQTGSVAHLTSYEMGIRKASIHLHLVLRLKMHEAISQLPHMPT